MFVFEFTAVQNMIFTFFFKLLLSKYLDSLWAQTQKLRKDKWETKCIRRPYLAFDGILGEAAIHPLPTFTPPPHTDESVYPVPKVVFRMFDYTDAPEVR